MSEVLLLHNFHRFVQQPQQQHVKSSVLKSITMSYHDIRYSNYFLAGFSSCGATIFTNPLEVCIGRVINSYKFNAIKFEVFFVESSEKER